MATDLPWRKSSFSCGGTCVEMAELPDGDVAVRNSNHPGTGMVTFTRAEIHAFLLGAKAGEFDDLAGTA
jgi:hypothetical protein